MENHLNHEGNQNSSLPERVIEDIETAFLEFQYYKQTASETEDDVWEKFKNSPWNRYERLGEMSRREFNDLRESVQVSLSFEDMAHDIETGVKEGVVVALDKDGLEWIIKNSLN